MTLVDDALRLRKQLQAGLNTEQAFLALFAFIDNTPTGRFGWFPLGDNAIYGAEGSHQANLWRERLQDSIDHESQVAGLLGLANLGITLRSIIATGAITPEDSKNLVIALRVLDAVFRGVNLTDAAFAEDRPGLRRLRGNLWRNKPLFSAGGLRVYPKPTRQAEPERRGQSSLTELLDVLTVIREVPHLRVDVRSIPSIAKVNHDGFLRIGIIPTIQRATELRWTREPENRYSIAEHENTEAIYNRVRAALDALIALEAQLVVLPELVSGAALINVLKSYLLHRAECSLPNPTLVLAGTYMVDHEGGSRRNRAVILDREGSEVWHQDKMHAYRFSKEDQANSGHPLGAQEVADLHEDIAIEPRTLVAVDLSPSQRLVVLTCEDFIQEAPHRPAVIDLYVTTLLVPIMAPPRRQPPAQGWVTDGAMNYVRHPGATSVVANSGTLLVNAGDQEHQWQFGEIRSSPRLNPAWEPVAGAPGQPPIAWFARLDRAV